MLMHILLDYKAPTCTFVADHSTCKNQRLKVDITRSCVLLTPVLHSS